MSKSPRQISVESSQEKEKKIRRDFPGPRGADAPLRVAIDRRANSELVAHAKDSLDREVCGVLVGQVAEDDEGVFVHVEAIIRGTAATSGATHVTFTQAAWDEIHATLEREYPKLRIVGWYHTHPGFGVEFSEMDIFVQRNFFPGPTQIALVTDPTNGAVAVAITSATGITYLPRYWVDGREQTAKVPASGTPVPTETAASPGNTGGSLEQNIKSLETRVAQLIEAQDEQRTLFQHMLLLVGLTFCLAILGTAGYLVYRSYSAPYEPPRVNSFVPVPVKVGEKTVLLGVGIVEWDVPPELNSVLVQVEQRHRDEAAKAAAAAAAAGKSTPADSTSTHTPDAAPSQPH